MNWIRGITLIGTLNVLSSAFAQEATEADKMSSTGGSEPSSISVPSTEPADAKGAQPDPTSVITAAATPEAAYQEEQVRRQNKDLLAKKAFDEAEDLYRQGQFKAAADKYDEVLRNVPNRPASDVLQLTAQKKSGLARMKLAENEYARDNLAEARRFAEEAKLSNPELLLQADKLISRASRRETLVKKREAVPVRPEDQPAVIEKQMDISRLFDEGRQWFAVEEYDKAEAQFELILIKDPYHRDAMRFLRKIEERRLQARNTHREATIVGMTDEVRRRWTPPIHKVVAKTDERVENDPIATETSQRKLMDKMTAIVIPSLEFRQAYIVDVINFLREASIAADPDGNGVNLLLKLPAGSAASAPSATPDASDPWGVPSTDGTGGESVSASTSVPLITLNLRKVTLLAAIKYVAEVANLKYRIEEAAVIIYPTGTVVESVLTRLYPVMPSIMDVVGESSDAAAATPEFGAGFSGGASAPTDNLKAFFEQNGVPFPVGSSITYNSTISKLIVANTAENLERFENILQRINVIPNQVEIEARFVEVNQNDLNELGLQWLLTDDWQLASKNGSGPAMAQPRIQVDENISGAGTLGFTKGLQYFGTTPDAPIPKSVSTNTASSLLGGILSMSGILTNPELTVVLHALDQKGGTDLLSAPRVTTRSGNNAQIQVVTEIIYPSEYEQQDIGDVTFGLGTAISDSLLRRPPLPSTFETRDTGIILNVTPTVGPDSYTIDLTLVPEVADLIGWIDYGPPGEYPILQPVFDSRNAQTSVVIWDGQTLTLGGLIREDTARMNDRIPLLGDIPLIGRLFRSEGEYSAKKNLMIFVTARIIDPAGNPIRSAEAPKEIGSSKTP